MKSSIFAILIGFLALNAWADPESIKVSRSATSGTSDFALSLSSTFQLVPANVPFLPAVALSGSFSDLLGKPTTRAGYGITDAASDAQGAKADTAVQPAAISNYSNTAVSGTLAIGNGSITFSHAGQISSVSAPSNLFLTSSILPGTQVSGTVPNAAWANGAPWSGLTNVPSMVNTLAASGSNIVLSSSNGNITISLTGLATAAQGAEADAALPAIGGMGTNITLTGTTGIRASGTGAAPFTLYQDPSNGQLMIAIPNGALAFYYDGTKPVMVFNGSIQCSDISASLNVASNIDAGIITTGLLPLARLPGWASNFSQGYPGYGQINSTPVNTPYFFNWTATDASGGGQTVAYRTASQIKTDMMMLTGTASITWSPISSASTGTATLTVTGADPASTPSVHLGWSAALPTGLEVAQAWVSGTNTVSIALRNNTGSTITPSAITVRATVHMP